MKNITELKKEIEEGGEGIGGAQIQLQTLQKVCEEIQVAFNKCSSCMLDIVKEKPRDNNTQRDWKQRIDELILLYSSISGLNYNEVKEELLNKLEDDEK